MLVSIILNKTEKMKPDSRISLRSLGKFIGNLWCYLFFDTMGILCGFVLPLICLFQFDSWTLYQTSGEILVVVLMLFLLFVIVTFVLASALTVLALPVSLVFKVSTNRFSSVLEITNLLSSIVIGGLMLLRPIKRSVVSMLTEEGRHWVTANISGVFGLSADNTMMTLGIVSLLSCTLFLLLRQPQIFHLVRKRIQLLGRWGCLAIIPASLIVLSRDVRWFNFHQIRPVNISLARQGMPNVILISIDALSAEDMSLYGYRRPTTPNLERLAAKSYVFDNFFATSNFTTPSTASLLTGVYAIRHKAYQAEAPVVPELRTSTIASSLKSLGYSTHAIVANSLAHPLVLKIEDGFHEVTERKIPLTTSLAYFLSYIEPLSGVSGFRHTVADIFDPISILLDKIKNDPALQESHPFPPETAFQSALTTLTRSDSPTFIWLHINPPHLPYLPAPEFKYRFGKSTVGVRLRDYESLFSNYEPNEQHITDELRARYDEFILDTDYRLGNFIDELESSRILDSSLVIITADHGESFERGHRFHGGPYLYQPVIHIPLLIHLPGQHQGYRVSAYADQTDILPTIHDLIGSSIPKWGDGESLKSSMIHGAPTSQAKFAMTFERSSRFHEPTNGTFSVIRDGWKLIHYIDNGVDELFHLTVDPQETTNLLVMEPQRAEQLRRNYQSRFGGQPNSNLRSHND